MGGSLVGIFNGVGRASCGAFCYFHSCSGCGVEVGNLWRLGQTPGCLLVAGLVAVEGGLGGGGVHSISSMNNQIDVASIPVTDGVSVAAPVPPRVAGCLCGISVGQD